MRVVLHLTERQFCLPKVAAKKNQVKLSIHLCRKRFEGPERRESYG